MSDAVPPPRDERYADGPAPGLTLRQQQTVRGLRHLDPQLAGMYERALGLLRQIDEPGNAAFVAFAGREISRGVIDRLRAEDGLPPVEYRGVKDNERNRALIADALSLSPHDVPVDQWFRLSGDFSAWMHYRHTGPPAKKVAAAFEQLSGFLWGRVAPYFETQSELRVLLGIERPSDEDARAARQLLLRPMQRTFFFGQLQHPGWIAPLAKAGVFANPPDRIVDPETGSWTARHWPEGEFLVRMATTEAEEVARILATVPPEITNPAVWQVVAMAACAVPPEYGAPLATRLCKALAAPGATPAPAEAIGLIARLAEANRNEAFRLAEYLLQVPDAPDESSDHEGIHWRFGRAQVLFPRLGWDGGDEFFSRAVPALERMSAGRTVRFLVGRVARVDRFAAAMGVPDSWIWRDAFGSDEDADEHAAAALATAAAAVGGRHAMAGRDEATAVWDLLKDKDQEIFRRLRLRILAAAGPHLQPMLDDFIASSESLDPSWFAREEALVVRAQFTNASQGARRIFRHGLLRGPEIGVLRRSLALEGITDPTEADLEREIARWQRRPLTWFRGNVPAELLDIAERAGMLGHEPDFREQELAEVGSVTGGFIWGDPDAPVSEAAPEVLSPEDVLDRIRPTPDNDVAQRPDPARLLREYAAIRPDDALRVATLADPEWLSSRLLDALFAGLRQALSAGHEIDWDCSLSLAEMSLDIGAERDGAAAAAKLTAIVEAAELIQKGSAEDHVPASLAPRVWAFLESALKLPELWRAEGREPLTSMEAVLLAALNEPAGDLTQALISTALWDYRGAGRLADEGDIAAARKAVAGRLVPLLKQLVEQEGRAAVPAHATIGQFLPQLHLLAPAWVERSAPHLLEGGAEDPLSRPVWGVYITTAQLYDSVFSALRPWYVRAAVAAGESGGWRPEEGDRWSLTENLAEHAIGAMLRGLVAVGDADQFLEMVFRHVPITDRAHAFWTIFRAWSDVTKPPPTEYVERLVAFWKWRLTELEATAEGDPARKEAGALAWLLRTPYLPDEIVARLGARTVRLGGDELDTKVSWERLLEIASADLEQTLDIAEAVIAAQLRARHGYIPADEVMPLLRYALRSGGTGIRERVVSLINRLGERGYLQFESLLGEDPGAMPPPLP